MKSYLILGAGRKGTYLAKKLEALGHEVMICDIDEKKINDVIDCTVAQRIGDVTDSNFIDSLGVNNFDMCFITISDNFEGSLKCSDLLKEKGAKHVVAFASNEIQEKYLKLSGADAVIFPEREVGYRVAIKYSNDSIYDYFALDDNYAIMEVKVPDEWVDKSIFDLDIRKKYDTNILGYKSGGKIKTITDPNFKFKKDICLLILANTSKITNLLKQE